MNKAAGHTRPFPVTSPIYSLLCADGLRQRSDDLRHHIRPDQLVQYAALVVVRLREGLERLLAPELPHGEVNSDRRFGETAGSHLVCVGLRLQSWAALAL